MPEMRYDPIHDIWVIVAEERLCRPDQFTSERFGFCQNRDVNDISRLAEEQKEKCPFCEGNESQTPRERDALARRKDRISSEEYSEESRECSEIIYAEKSEHDQGCVGFCRERTIDDYRRPNSPGWQVRSVPNRYPSVLPWGEMTSQRFGIHEKTLAVGAQEVIVDTPRHLERFGEMTEEEFQYLIHFYHRRLYQLRKEHRWQYVQLFKNQGAAAGASMCHIHSQIFCLPYVPHTINMEAYGLEKYFQNTGQCYYCQSLHQELTDRWRFIAESETMAAFCPFTSRFHGEIWVMPKRHVPCFVQSSREELDDLSLFLRKIICRLEQVIPVPTYNVVLRQSPWRYEESGVVLDERFHWRLEILPRLNGIAGFEWGTGNFINPCSPERFAAEMVSRSP
ncbi:MAG: DUF4931 domain-containing protein [Planctomycetia bacterium]|nr:DUF4931 domain-containing protein [Planctomycetia bacterium]